MENGDFCCVIGREAQRKPLRRRVTDCGLDATKMLRPHHPPSIN
jgi:hypothetical protein